MLFHKEICIRDLNLEFDTLESTATVDWARATTATSHKTYLDIKLVDVSDQIGLSNLFSSSQARKEKLENEKRVKTDEAFQKYHKQGDARKGDHEIDLMQICQI